MKNWITPATTRRKLVIASTCTLAVAVTLSAQRPDPIRAASDALGATKLKTIRMNGFGASYTVGQSPSPSEPWPRVQIKAYDAAINYDTEAMTVDLTREMGAIPPRGGGVPFNGEQRQIQAISGTAAWNVAFAGPTSPAGGRADTPNAAPDAPADPARPTVLQPQEIPDIVPPAAQGGGRGRGTLGAGPPLPAPADAAERMLQIWLTPHGFLKAALANTATTRSVAGGTEVSFVLGKRYNFTGLISRNNEVDWVRTWIANPVLGDMVVEAAYSNYRKIDSVSFPMRIVQRQGGHPSLDLWLFSTKANDAVDIMTPRTVRSATVPPARVELQKIAQDVYYITGGTHHSVAIEMTDHVVMVEAPLDEARSLAVIAKIKETIPNKPIRFVVNTHHHFDHAGGLRSYADEGATIVTHHANRAYYETVWAAPRTLNPDRLAQSKKTPKFETFTDKHLLTDGARTIEIYRIANSPHDDGLAMVYLPGEKILIEADAYVPAADAAPVPPQTPVIRPATLNLYQNIRRLKLDVARIAALHGPRVATMAELTKAAGREESH
jgi:glyoxylase-like metal-dependent hydrolase (beta-lactamase superfamily II)